MTLELVTPDICLLISSSLTILELKRFNLCPSPGNECHISVPLSRSSINLFFIMKVIGFFLPADAPLVAIKVTAFYNHKKNTL